MRTDTKAPRDTVVLDEVFTLPLTGTLDGILVSSAPARDRLQQHAGTVTVRNGYLTRQARIFEIGGFGRYVYIQRKLENGATRPNYRVEIRSARAASSCGR